MDTREKVLWYRFAIQNNEDVSLAGNYRMTISSVDEGRFLDDDSQKLFVGCNLIGASMDRSRRVFILEFSELPAYDTWSIECRTDDQARSLSVCVENFDQVPTPLDMPGRGNENAAVKLFGLPAVLSHTSLSLSRDRDTAFEGAAFTPEGRWAAAAWFIAVLSFFLRAYFRHADWWDLLPPFLLALVAWGLWHSIRRRAPSISQGYWTATPLSDLLSKAAAPEPRGPSDGKAAAVGAA